MVLNVKKCMCWYLSIITDSLFQKNKNTTDTSLILLVLVFDL